MTVQSATLSVGAWPDTEAPTAENVPLALLRNPPRARQGALGLALQSDASFPTTAPGMHGSLRCWMQYLLPAPAVGWSACS